MYICIFHLADQGEPVDHSAEFPNRGIIANHNIERHNTWSRRKVSNKSSYKYNSASQYCTWDRGHPLDVTCSWQL